MIIYHGSEKLVQEPKFGKGNTRNDYGLGFYCTESPELAKEWACLARGKNGFANKYEICLDGLRILDLTKSEYSVLHWLALLLRFRTFDISSPVALEARRTILGNYHIDIDEYDVIIGYRADDSYFSFAKDFVNNSISVEQLASAMELGKPGTQIVIKSKKAFALLKWKGYELADAREHYPKRATRDERARNEYFQNLRKVGAANGTFVMDIIREEGEKRQ